MQRGVGQGIFGIDAGMDREEWFIACIARAKV